MKFLRGAAWVPLTRGWRSNHILLVKLFMVLRERRKPVITGMFLRQTAAAGLSACAHRLLQARHRGPKGSPAGGREWLLI